MKKNLLALVVLFSAMSTIARAGDDKDAKAIEVPADTTPSRWSLSAGVTLSSIKTTFRADPGLNPGFFAGALGGSNAFYTNGAPVVYADGTVGVDTGNGNVAHDPAEGVTGFTGGTVTTLAVDVNDSDYSLQQATFHSVGGSASPFGSDSDTGLSVGPYIKLAYLLKQWDETNSISLFAQYTFTTAYNSGAPASNSGLSVNAFTYDVFNGDVSNTVGGAAVYDAVTFNNNVYPGNFAGTGLRQALPPSEISTAVSLGIYEPESINIYLHTFTLGLDFTHDLGSRVHLVLSTGPTLNLFDFDYKTPGIAVVDGFAVQYANPQNDEGQKFRFGWVGRLGVSVDLDSQKIYFAELSGEYHYIQDFDVATNIGSATVHPSSWGVSLGLGRRF